MAKPRQFDKLTQARLKSVLDYHRDTGEFWWIAKPHPKMNDDVFDRPAGLVITGGYRRIRLDGEVYLAHRLAWFFVCGWWPPEDVDHVNGERDDNRIDNLRLASRSQNRANAQKPWRIQKYPKGVTSWGTTAKFAMQISFKGQRYTEGPFDTPDEAHAAYCRKAEELHGEFASFKVNLSDGKPTKRLTALEEAEWEDVCGMLAASWPQRTETQLFGEWHRFAGASAGLVQ